MSFPSVLGQPISFHWSPDFSNKKELNESLTYIIKSSYNILCKGLKFSDFFTLCSKAKHSRTLYNARTYLQLPLRQWGAGNVYLLVLSS